VLPALHVRTQSLAGTFFFIESNVIPQSGPLFIAPVAITAIIDIGKWDALHKLAIL
jgi:hypothetical protein